VQQHEGQQAVHLRLIGHQLGEGAPQAQRLVGHLVTPTPPLVEDQVEDREHGCQTIGQQVVGRHSKRNPGSLDLALCPYQPLGHRRFLDEEGARDLAGAQASERAQSEGDLRVGGECGMAAGEHELESLV
jgi:hypothetical protein